MPEISPEELKKKNFLEALQFVGDKRQHNFVQTFEKMVHKKREEAKKEPFCERTCRKLGKLLLGIVILLFVSPMLWSLYR